MIKPILALFPLLISCALSSCVTANYIEYSYKAKSEGMGVLPFDSFMDMMVVPRGSELVGDSQIVKGPYDFSFTVIDEKNKVREIILRKVVVAVQGESIDVLEQGVTVYNSALGKQEDGHLAEGGIIIEFPDDFKESRYAIIGIADLPIQYDKDGAFGVTIEMSLRGIDGQERTSESTVWFYRKKKTERLYPTT
jgi:hypothetical protein